MEFGPRKKIVVAGLVWEMADPREGDVTDAALVGPAVGAALGVRAAGAEPEMLVSVTRGRASETERFLRALDTPGRLLKYSPSPPLRWRARPVIAETKNWKLEGNPRAGSVAVQPHAVEGQPAVLANGDPKAHAAFLAQCRPPFAAIDVDAGWGRSDVPALQECLRHVHLVTVTEADRQRLPVYLLAGSGAGQCGGPALVLKSGARGVTVTACGETRVLPPPPVRGRVRTDVGAGDLLLGFLAGRLSLAPPPVRLEDLMTAYQQSRPVTSLLLESLSFTEFASTLLGDALLRTCHGA